LAFNHLAAMVEDYLMKITHVIRAQNGTSLPLHALICRLSGGRNQFGSIYRLSQTKRQGK
jgi:glutamyl/glutaminyl-tRNA synthetase